MRVSMDKNEENSTAWYSTRGWADCSGMGEEGIIDELLCNLRKEISMWNLNMTILLCVFCALTDKQACLWFYHQCAHREHWTLRETLQWNIAYGLFIHTGCATPCGESLNRMNTRGSTSQRRLSLLDWRRDNYEYSFTVVYVIRMCVVFLHRSFRLL